MMLPAVKEWWPVAVAITLPLPGLRAPGDREGHRRQVAVEVRGPVPSGFIVQSL
jgi:hypothetical protein